MDRRDVYIGFEAPGPEIKARLVEIAEEEGTSLQKLMQIATVIFVEAYESAPVRAMRDGRGKVAKIKAGLRLPKRA